MQLYRIWHIDVLYKGSSDFFHFGSRSRDTIFTALILCSCFENYIFINFKENIFFTFLIVLGTLINSRPFRIGDVNSIISKSFTRPLIHTKYCR